MNYIDSILNDGSKNDKQLVKELSMCLKNHRDKGLPINKKLVLDLIDIVLKNSEINYNEILFNPDDIVGGWYSDGEIVELDITKINNVSKKMQISKTLDSYDYRLYAYYYLLVVIIHELTHARQTHLLKSNMNNLYLICNSFVDNYYNIYDVNHDLILSERYANLRGETKSYEVLSYLYPRKQIYNIQERIFDYLFCGYCLDEDDPFDQEYYSVTSAIDIHNEIMSSVNYPLCDIEYNEGMSLYDRFYLGLPISYNEYVKIDNLFYDMFLNKDSEIRKENTNIMKLINRCETNK